MQMVPDTVSLPHDQHTCKSAFTHIHTHTHTHTQEQTSTPGFKLTPGLLQLSPRHVQGAPLSGVCVRQYVCVCVCVSMLNIGHCNCQPSDITNCTERSRREAAGREYTENDLSITFLMAISDGGAGVVVYASLRKRARREHHRYVQDT
jgi:hypothetical protein